MPMSDANFSKHINYAINALNAGGVIAYPTEYCFGLGCDPQNIQAIEKLLAIKQRQKEQGVILIASDLDQVSEYANVSSLPNLEAIKNSWPGPNTWVLPVQESVTNWVKGRHLSIAMRISAFEVCQQLCQGFGGAIVSTSANRHGQNSLVDAESVAVEFGQEVDYILDLPVQFHPSESKQTASIIRDAISGKQLR